MENQKKEYMEIQSICTVDKSYKKDHLQMEFTAC